MSRDHTEIIYAHALYEALDEFGQRLTGSRSEFRDSELCRLMWEIRAEVFDLVRQWAMDNEVTVAKDGLVIVEPGTY